MEFVTQRENGEYIKPDIMKYVGRVIHGKATKNGIAILNIKNPHFILNVDKFLENSELSHNSQKP